VTIARVLITGAGGFIGRHLVRDQLARGHQVRALDRSAEALRDLPAHGNLESMVGDVTNPEVQRTAVAGVDVVFHLASAHLERRTPYAHYRRTNVEAVESLVDASGGAGVGRFVHVSSSSVHGNIARPPADEAAPFQPDIAYERSKADGEVAALNTGRHRGVPVVVARPVWVYGPGCRRTARLFGSVAGGRFVWLGRGANRRSCVYITDCLEGLELCARTPGVDGEAFLLTHDEPVTVRQIVEQIAAVVGAPVPRWRAPISIGWAVAGLAELAGVALRKAPPLSRRSLKFFTTDAGFTGAKARAMLGFTPKVNLRRGLDMTCHWWRSNGGGH